MLAAMSLMLWTVRIPNVTLLVANGTFSILVLLFTAFRQLGRAGP